MTALTVKNYALPAVDEKEVLRYAACREANEQVLALLRECVKEAEEKLKKSKKLAHTFAKRLTNKVFGIIMKFN